MSRKVAFASNTAWNLYNFRGGVMRRLIDDGAEVVAIAPPDEFSGKLLEMGCVVVDLPMDNKGSNPIRDLATWHEFYRVYREVRPDVALHFTIKPVIYGSLAARVLGVPVINTITGLGTAFLREGWLMRVVEALYRFSQRWPEQVFFQNRDDHALFVGRSLVRADKAAVLPGSGINIERFSSLAYPENAGPVFLLIARLLRDKGVVEYVEAARRLKSRYPQTCFQLLGPLGVANRTAISGDEIESWVKEGVVEYLGETDDVRPFIAVADCVVLPSYREGVPRTLLEAAAMARPLVATDVPGCREVVADRENGYLCRARDAGDLAERMEQMILLPEQARAAMGVAGRVKVEREFDERVVVDRYLSAIDTILAGKHEAGKAAQVGAREMRVGSEAQGEPGLDELAQFKRNTGGS